MAKKEIIPDIKNN